MCFKPLNIIVLHFLISHTPKLLSPYRHYLHFVTVEADECTLYIWPLDPQPLNWSCVSFHDCFLFGVKSYVFELDHGPIQNSRPLTPYRLPTVNFFTAFPYASGCEVRYCFVIFLRVPQFSSPLHAWYNLGLMPPSSTQVAGDRFNPSIYVFLPTRA